MDERWNRNYELANDYYEKHKNLLIPNKYEIEGVKLGVWIANQRSFYRGNRKHRLLKEQIDKLEAIGMVWDVLASLWEEKYELAKNYYKEYGNLLIPPKYEINNIKLGQWIITQRQAYNYKSKKKFKYNISKEQIKKLEEIGMVWDVVEYKWYRNYKLVKEYFKEYGNINIPPDYIVDNVQLSKWIQNQKKYYFYGQTFKDYKRIELLEQLGIKIPYK